MKTIQSIVNKHYEAMFEELMEVEGDNLYDLVVEIKTLYDGLTVRRSWRDRDNFVKDRV